MRTLALADAYEALEKEVAEYHKLTGEAVHSLVRGCQAIKELTAERDRLKAELAEANEHIKRAQGTLNT